LFPIQLFIGAATPESPAAIRTHSVDFQPSGYTSAGIRAAGITLDNPVSTSAMDQRATGAV
jgi:hypothetical protein